MNQHSCRMTLAAMLLFVAAPGVAQDVNVAVFTPPEPDSRINPAYPDEPLRRGEEGQVELNFMVDQNGKPFEITVSNSTGDEAFRREAVRWVERSNFKPATVDGTPTIGSFRTLVRFKLEGPSGASRTFIRSYSDFLATLESEEDAKKAIEVLAGIAKNHYENAYLNMAHYLWASKFGTSVEQLDYLFAALSFSQQPSDIVYLPDDEVRAARRELFRLQVANQRFQEALYTYALFKATDDAEAMEVFKPVITQLQTLASDDKAFSMPLTLDERGIGSMHLLKRNVYVQQVTGKVREFKVRCEQKYIGFAVEPEVSYHLPGEWGVCHLEIVGDAGTTFSLVQH